MTVIKKTVLQEDMIVMVTCPEIQTSSGRTNPALVQGWMEATSTMARESGTYSICSLTGHLRQTG